MDELIGIDIGGSTISLGRVKAGKIIEEIGIVVKTESISEDLISELLFGINSLNNMNVQGIGVGVPAVVDPISGTVYNVQNTPSWKEIQLKNIIQKKFSISVFLNNDANCFAYGEKIFGNGRDYENFMGLSIGTGLGMGIIINNALYNGVLCGAGEIGMISYKDSILEDYTSSFFFKSHYKKTAQQLDALVDQGDESAQNAFKEFRAHLGEALKNILYLYATKSIILGGSISQAYEYFKESIDLKLQSFTYPKQIEHLKIKVSETTDTAILGAAALCM